MALSDPRKDFTAVVASGASLSGAVTLGGYRLAGVVMPADWTAANLTFQGSHDGTTYWNVYDDAGSEVSVTAAEDRDIGIRANVALALAPWRFLKVRSGTSGTPVNQAADRTLTLIGVPA